MTSHEWYTYHQCTLWRFCKLLLIKKPSQCLLPKQLSTCFHWVFTIISVENHLTLFKDSRVFLSGLLSLMGTSDMNSTPPAITVSHWPLAISPTAFRIKKKEKRKKEIILWETQPLKELWRSIATINYF